MGQHKLSGARTAALALTMVLSTSCATVAEHAEDGQKEPTETTNPYLHSLQESVEGAQEAPEPSKNNGLPAPFFPQYRPPADDQKPDIDPSFIEALREAIREAQQAPDSIRRDTIPFTPRVENLDDQGGPC